MSNASSDTSTTLIHDVVIWEGEYKNDGIERMKWINSAANRVIDAYIVGEPGKWKLIVAGPSYDRLAA